MLSLAKDGAPVALISENGCETACLLPTDLAGWVGMVLSRDEWKDLLFPGNVKFQYSQGRFCADFYRKEISASENLRGGGHGWIKLKGHVYQRPGFHLLTVTDFIA